MIRPPSGLRSFARSRPGNRPRFASERSGTRAGGLPKPFSTSIARCCGSKVTAISKRKRQRVCVVAHSYYPQDPRVRREARVAIAHGYQVDAFVLRHQGDQAEEVVDGVHVRRLPVEHRPGASKLHMLFEYLRFTALCHVGDRAVAAAPPVCDRPRSQSPRLSRGGCAGPEAPRSQGHPRHPRHLL